MKQYLVIVEMIQREKYHVEADTPEEAKGEVLSGNYDPYESAWTSVKDISVEEE